MVAFFRRPYNCVEQFLPNPLFSCTGQFLSGGGPGGQQNNTAAKPGAAPGGAGPGQGPGGFLPPLPPGVSVPPGTIFQHDCIGNDRNETLLICSPDTSLRCHSCRAGPDFPKSAASTARTTARTTARPAARPAEHAVTAISAAAGAGWRWECSS